MSAACRNPRCSCAKRRCGTSAKRARLDPEPGTEQAAHQEVPEKQQGHSHRNFPRHAQRCQQKRVELFAQAEAVQGHWNVAQYRRRHYNARRHHERRRITRLNSNEGDVHGAGGQRIGDHRERSLQHQ